MAARPESIGSATMLADGTLILDLRAQTPEGSTEKVSGHTRYILAPDHPNYAETVAHLGGIKPGENRPVPPWK